MTGAVIAVASAKGGVGKTTTSINLAAALSELDLSTVIVEYDLAMANIVDFLQLGIDSEDDSPTIHDVLMGDISIEDAVYSAPGGFDVVPSGTDLQEFADSNPRMLQTAIKPLLTTYDVILIDTGAGVSYESLLPLGVADIVVLVSSPRAASVRNTKKTLELTERLHGAVAGVIFVQSGTGTAPPVKRIATFLGVPLLGHVPEDDTVPASQDAGLPVLVHRSQSDAASAYREIAIQLCEIIDERINNGT